MLTNQKSIDNYYSLNDKFIKILDNIKISKIEIPNSTLDKFNKIKNNIQNMIQDEQTVSDKEFSTELKLLNSIYNEIYKEMKLLEQQNERF